MSNAVIDGIIKDWGERLHYSPVKGSKGRNIRSGGSTKPAKPAPPSGPATKEKVARTAKKTAEVMVKISGGGKNMKHIKAHMDYISRNGEVEIEDENGDIHQGMEAVRDVRDSWAKGKIGIPYEGEGSKTKPASKKGGDEQGDSAGSGDDGEAGRDTGELTSWPKGRAVSDPDRMSKPLLLVEFDGRSAAVLLNRRPSSAGLIHIRFEDGGDVAEVCDLTFTGQAGLLDARHPNPVVHRVHIRRWNLVHHRGHAARIRRIPFVDEAREVRLGTRTRPVPA